MTRWRVLNLKPETDNNERNERRQKAKGRQKAKRSTRRQWKEEIKHWRRRDKTKKTTIEMTVETRGDSTTTGNVDKKIQRQWNTRGEEYKPKLGRRR